MIDFNDILAVIQDEYATTHIMVVDQPIEKLKRARSWRHYTSTLQTLRNTPDFCDRLESWLQQTMSVTPLSPKQRAQIIISSCLLTDSGRTLNIDVLKDSCTRETLGLIILQSQWSF